MYELAKALLLLPTFILLIAHFILLILRLDHIADLSFYWIGAPAFAGYGIGFLIFIFLAASGYPPTLDFTDRMLCGALATVFIGCLVTQFLLACKFQTDMLITYTAALLPLLISFAIGFVLAATGLLIKRRDKQLLQQQKTIQNQARTFVPTGVQHPQQRTIVYYIRKRV